eukprot:PhM_4_TR18076/c1_g1_i1/m.44715
MNCYSDDDDDNADDDNNKKDATLDYESIFESFPNVVRALTLLHSIAATSSSCSCSVLPLDCVWETLSFIITAHTWSTTSEYLEIIQQKLQPGGWRFLDGVACPISASAALFMCNELVKYYNMNVDSEGTCAVHGSAFQRKESMCLLYPFVPTNVVRYRGAELWLHADRDGGNGGTENHVFVCALKKSSQQHFNDFELSARAATSLPLRKGWNRVRVTARGLSVASVDAEPAGRALFERVTRDDGFAWGDVNVDNYNNTKQSFVGVGVYYKNGWSRVKVRTTESMSELLTPPPPPPTSTAAHSGSPDKVSAMLALARMRV